MPFMFWNSGSISGERLVSVDAKLSKRSGVERKQLPSVHRPITPHCAPWAARDENIIPFFPSLNQIQVQLEFTHFFRLLAFYSKTTKKATFFWRFSVEYRLHKKNNQKKCRTMNDTKIASKAKAQLSNFMGKVFTHFPKPTRKFIEECFYGIQASGDTNSHLSCAQSTTT